MNIIDSIEFISAVLGILGFTWGVVQFFSDKQRHRHVVTASALLVTVCCVVFLAAHFTANDTQEPRITIEPQLVHQTVTIGQHTITVAYKASSRQVISTLTGWGGL